MYERRAWLAACVGPIRQIESMWPRQYCAIGTAYTPGQCVIVTLASWQAFISGKKSGTSRPEAHMCTHATRPARTRPARTSYSSASAFAPDSKRA